MTRKRRKKKNGTNGELMDQEKQDAKPQEDEDEKRIVTYGELLDRDETCEKSQVLKVETSKSEMIETNLECDFCSFSTENKNIFKLHLLSHKFSENKILNTLPSSLKDLTFNSEEEFNQNMDVFLESLSSNDI